MKQIVSKFNTEINKEIESAYNFTIEVAAKNIMNAFVANKLEEVSVDLKNDSVTDFGHSAYFLVSFSYNGRSHMVNVRYSDHSTGTRRMMNEGLQMTSRGQKNANFLVQNYFGLNNGFKYEAR